uniref:Uncharacterized protein n=1 Tax=Oryza sativa subsp. japonica TaxID=39947 RepID=Q5VNF1_ORYSJ|nr:hypothetical protein [Oryza sativa Japonica Group]
MVGPTQGTARVGGGAGEIRRQWRAWSSPDRSAAGPREGRSGRPGRSGSRRYGGGGRRRERWAGK